MLIGLTVVIYIKFTSSIYVERVRF